MTHAIAPLLKRFFSHYMPVQKGYSKNTVCAYRDAIKLLLCHIADTLKKSVDNLTVQDVAEIHSATVRQAVEHFEQAAAS